MPDDERAKVLLKWAKPFELNRKKDIKYILNKLASILRGKKFNKNSYFLKDIPLDIVSHSNHCIENKPTIGWIPDFQHVHLPQMFSEEEMQMRGSIFKNCARKSKIVILSSNDALKDFKNFAPEYAHKARVLQFVAIFEDDIYEKTDNIKDEIVKKFAPGEKYFYLPNQFWKHKNHKVVFEAIAILKKQGISINVVLSGNIKDYRHPEYFDELMAYVKKEDIEENLKFLGLIDILEVHYFMRNCVSIINPSFFEGWSSTVEEAKSLGKNIILSNINVHVEQNPQEALYFDPHNANELAGILKNKWESSHGGPDYKLEKEAQRKLEERIENFGKCYQKIVVEAL